MCREGTIPRYEWADEDEPPQVGDSFRILVEDVEDAMGN